MDRRLGGPQSRSGRGEEKNSQPPAVAQRYTTELSWLLPAHIVQAKNISKIFKRFLPLTLYNQSKNGINMQ
jgi:hypothetical protein